MDPKNTRSSESKRLKREGIMKKVHSSPALTPEAPAILRPFFLTIKLAPMKKLEDKAKTKPLMLSLDMPLRGSLQGLSELEAGPLTAMAEIEGAVENKNS